MLRAVRYLGSITLVMGVLAGACAYGEIRHVLRAEFANELDCPEVRVEKKGFVYLPEEKEDAEHYTLNGCGVVRTYSCPPDRGVVPYGESGCTWVEGDPERPEAAETSGGEDALADEPVEGEQAAPAEAEGEPDSTEDSGDDE